ncbi:hypothetical protein DPPLL_24920 [Desulfofustis limnaeus]|uniref:Uncharacterized protein n=1 Tax=Desulfofustis limnaeus TaxID=2740163 RepID=A0ABM7WB04_9BACT|nr:hypothetical protein DPPLL_24920 [Desulfofustis limnaeus]
MLSTRKVSGQNKRRTAKTGPCAVDEKRDCPLTFLSQEAQRTKRLLEPEPQAGSEPTNFTQFIEFVKGRTNFDE